MRLHANSFGKYEKRNVMMSLTKSELTQTRTEMARNYEQLNMPPSDIQKALNFSPLNLKNVLEVVPDYNPTNIWKLRDYLEEKLKEPGKLFYPFSILTTNRYYPYEKNW